MSLFIYTFYLLTAYSRTISSCSHYVCVNYFLFNEQNFHSFSLNSIGWVENNELQTVWKWMWHNLKHYLSHQGQWSKDFPEIKEQSQNSRCHTGYTQQVPYWGPTNIWHHCTKFSCPGYVHLWLGLKQSWRTSFYNQPPGSNLNLAAPKHKPRPLTT